MRGFSSGGSVCLVPSLLVIVTGLGSLSVYRLGLGLVRFLRRDIRYLKDNYAVKPTVHLFGAAVNTFAGNT